MEWIIPGTVLSGKREDAALAEQQFSAMFLGGGIVLSQVSAVTGLEPYTIQNWVKRGFLMPPERKRYSLCQLCRIININMLKPVLPLEQICGLLSYVNGNLDDESDDMIDDSKLYFMFLRISAGYTAIHSAEERDHCIATELANYQEPVPGARDRVEKVLRIFLTAWASAQLRQRAEEMINSIRSE